MVTEAPNGHTIASLAAHLGGVVAGRGDLVIKGFAPLQIAKPDQITFIVDQRWAAKWKESDAGAAVVTRDVELPELDLKRRALIRVSASTTPSVPW
jgi:UDP-3-O-[3-hydroxymyristoyl] glucosamine N-acyltransferase